MKNNNRSIKLAAMAIVTGACLLISGCSSIKDHTTAPANSSTANATSAKTLPNAADHNDQDQTAASAEAHPAQTPSTTEDISSKPEKDAGNNRESKATTSVPPLQKPSASSAAAKNPDAVQVVASPADIAVMVNKSFKLPENYKPLDLVEPDVPFTFKVHLEKRKMRKEAAAALENLFAATKKAGVPLAGVSAYRSYETQKTLYNNYVKKDGEAAANKYSAKPGTSEHQTGLAIDVSGSNGQCAASDCFADTKEAKWLERHASDFGFIIRYPKGKEAITGYQYEPWHLRYVGIELAKVIATKGLTLEEYFGYSVPVAKPK